jgi:hypothetical protein
MIAPQRGAPPGSFLPSTPGSILASDEGLVKGRVPRRTLARGSPRGGARAHLRSENARPRESLPDQRCIGDGLSAELGATGRGGAWIPRRGAKPGRVRRWRERRYSSAGPWRSCRPDFGPRRGIHAPPRDEKASALPCAPRSITASARSTRTPVDAQMPRGNCPAPQ